MHGQEERVGYDIMDAAKTVQRLGIEVSGDRLQAWIRPVDPDDPTPFTVEETVGALEDAKIVVDGPVRKRIDEFVDPTSDDDDRQKRFLIAEGRPAVEGTDETFLRAESLVEQEQDWQGDTAINYYTYSSIHLVQKDEPIGTLVPVVASVNGVDVLGKILSPARKLTVIELGSGVRRSEDDPTLILADTAGQIEFSKGVISLNEVFIVAGDVDFGTGNIDSPIDVQIRGTVRDGFAVKSSRSIVIGGAIEAANVDSEGDVIVRGGILQKGKNSVTSRGDIVARFCDEANLHADGEVKVCKELLNSQIHCEGTLFAGHGAVIGGCVYAREGVEVATLGSDANIKTEVVVGTHLATIEEADRIRESMKSKKASAQRIRSTVQPLMDNLKRLSPAQREKATELMFEADEMEVEVAEAETKCLAMIRDASAQGIPSVLVSKIIHQGVTVRIGRRMTSFDKSMRGPLKIEERKVKNVTELVAINQQTGSVSVVPSHCVKGKQLEQATQSVEPEHKECDGSGR